MRLHLTLHAQANFLVAAIVQRQNHLAVSQAGWVTARAATASPESSCSPSAEAKHLMETASVHRESQLGFGCPEFIRLEECKTETITGIDSC